jgi:predicted nucleic acid-binding protein
MNKCVLDSSVIIKGFFPPKHSLPLEIYNREIVTHQKCIFLFKIIEEQAIEILLPKVSIVEVAAVSRRFTDVQTSQKITSRLYSTSTLVSEDELFHDSWKIAESQSCSGFDSYFIALAYQEKIPLFTDDEGMHYHALKKGVQSIFMRISRISDIEELFYKY